MFRSSSIRGTGTDEFSRRNVNDPYGRRKRNEKIFARSLADLHGDERVCGKRRGRPKVDGQGTCFIDL